MNEIHSISLANTPLYKGVDFKIPKGLSVVYGVNRTDSRTKNGNGAGKSYLFSQIGEVLYEEPSVGTKADKVTEGTRTLRLKLANGKKVVIKRTNSKVEVECDGKVQNRTVTQAREWIRNNIPISQEEFNTHVYIDSRVGHPLVLGSNAQRKAFFTSFFQLDKIDEEKKLVSAELRKLKNLRSVYTERVKDYNDLKSKLKGKAKPQEIKAKLSKVKASLEEVQGKQELYHTYVQQQGFLKAAQTHLKPVQAHVKEVDEGSLTSLKSQIQKKLNLATRRQEQAKKYEYYVQQKKEYEAYVSKLTPRVKKLLEQGLSKEELISKEQEHREALKQNKRITDDIEQLSPKKPTKVDKPKVARDTLIEQRLLLNRQLTMADKHKKGVCDSCGQAVKLPDVKKVKARLDKVVNMLSLHDKYKDYKAKKKLYKKQVKQKTNLQEEQQQVLTKLEDSIKYAGVTKALDNYVKEPKPYKGKPVTLDKVLNTISKYRDLSRHVEFLLNNLDLLERKETSTPVDYSKQLQKLNKEYTELRADYEVTRAYGKQLAPLRATLLDMKKQLKDEEILNHLLQAYGDKATKKMVVDSISKMLVDEINKYARLVFPENFTFDFKWGSTVSLTVTRRNGKKVQTTDVRRLSGGEYRLFTLVLVLALLAFVPPSKRTSVLILDEPTANMHKETAERMVHILQAMQTLVPSIVVITPHDDEVYEGAKNFTVIKENGQSRLEKGHPAEL